MKLRLFLSIIAFYVMMISAYASEHREYGDRYDHNYNEYSNRHGNSDFYDPHYDEHRHLHSRQLTITKRDYILEDNFDVDSDQGHLGNVIQNSVSFRKNYHYYNHHGDLISSAYVKIPSLGSLMTSATVMSVYDSQERLVGTIEGCLMTLSPATFYFYDNHNNFKGTADMAKDRCSFNIYHAHHSQKIVAALNRAFVRDVQDWWTVDIIDAEAIDPRLLISFAAFVVDTQVEYKKDQ